ncbi:MAG: SDR family oxidoreductase [Syntrophaceae bacterium]|nr:SDR family oxidoreductase [Syntrophaceae bacterium]
MKVLVTGANGFIGTHLCRALESSAAEVVRVVRKPQPGAVAVGSINGATDWAAALPGVEAIVHLAGRVHIVKDTSLDPLVEFRKTNVDSTLNLARQAAQAGVKRFVFISSIAVHGLTSNCQPFSPQDVPHPHDPYGLSKLEAEKGLKEISAETGLLLVIIRPPLVYGPRVHANFLRLMKLAASGLPLPLGAVRNQRNPVFVGNLCDLILKCLTHPAAVGQTFLVSDDRDISTPQLLRLLTNAMNKKTRLFPIPRIVMRLAGRLTGHSGEIARLCDSLQVDISHTKELLDWTPPYTLEEGIQATVRDYLSARINRG